MQANLLARTARIKQKPTKVGGGFLGWEARRAEQLAETVAGGPPRVVSQVAQRRIRAAGDLEQLVKLMRRKFWPELLIVAVCRFALFTAKGNPHTLGFTHSRVRLLTAVILESRPTGKGKYLLELRGLPKGFFAAAMGGKGRPYSQNSVYRAFRELQEAGILRIWQPQASKVAKNEKGKPKRTYRVVDGKRVYADMEFAFNRIQLRLEDWVESRPAPPEETPGYLKSVVAELATTAEETAFLAELDDILANARPRETRCWPAGDVEPPEGGRGPPN
jgi:hypothetical protein